MPLKLLLWSVVPLVGILELVGHFYVSSRAPELSAWRDLRPAVAELVGDDPKTLVVVAPRWAEPNARYAFGDDLMPFEHVARADVSAFERAVEVGLRGASSPELEGWTETSSAEQGAFRLRLLENPAPADVQYDFLDEIADATVLDVSGRGEERCRWEPRARSSAGGLHGHPAFPSERHQCSGQVSHFVGVTAVEDDQWRGRRCLWAEPRAGRTLVIRYDDVPLGRVVRGYATRPWWVERERRAGPVRLEVRVGGTTLGRYVHEDGDGWKPFEFPTGELGGTRATVELRVSSPRDPQFCLVADTR